MVLLMPFDIEHTGGKDILLLIMEVGKNLKKNELHCDVTRRKIGIFDTRTFFASKTFSNVFCKKCNVLSSNLQNT
jgi:hypothetical protein